MRQLTKRVVQSLKSVRGSTADRPLAPRAVLAAVQPLEDRVVPAVLDFTLLPAQSNLTLAGSLNGLPITGQAPEAMRSAFSGAIRVGLDLDANTIAFLNSGPDCDGTVTGNWQPDIGGLLGTSPADYGGSVASILASLAIRNAALRLSSATPLGLTGSNTIRSFPSTQAVNFTSGSLDFNATLVGLGSQNLAGATSGNASALFGAFEDLGDGSAKLTTPLIASLNGSLLGLLPITYALSGGLVGLCPFPTVDPNGPATGFNASVDFTAGGPAVTLAPLLETRLLSGNTLASATVRLAPCPDGAAESLAVTLSGGLTSSGYDPTTGTLTISGVASLEVYQTVLQSIRYVNVLPGATVGIRTVTILLNNGIINSLAHTIEVNVGRPAAQVDGDVTVNAGQANTVQRSKVTRLDIAFNSTITFAGPVADAFVLTRLGGGAVGGFTATANLVNGRTVVTLTGFSGSETQFGSLADGRFSVRVRASQVVGGLDGNGDGIAGDDYVFNGSTTNGLFRLYGDVNGDGITNAIDFSQFRTTLGASAGQQYYIECLDVDNSGVVNAFDFSQFRPRFGAGVP